MDKTRVKSDIQRWRKRGFYSESILVKKLEKHGYKAVRVPVSNPSRNPLPDVIARQGQHIYAFEVKRARSTPTSQRNRLRSCFVSLIS